MSTLFTPLQINGIKLKNRIVFPPITTNFADNGAPSLRHLVWHGQLAKNGCALTMLEATYMETARHNYRMALDEDRIIEPLARLADTVHEAGGLLGIQLQHQGRSATPLTTGCVQRLVSVVPGLTPDSPELVMSQADIQHIIQLHLQAVRRAVKAGVDLIELHGAHGYLIAQFLSPLTNKREDEYGGNFERRMRFPLELLKAVREEVGASYPITVRLSVDEKMPGGLDLEQSMKICAVLADHGIDAISFSASMRESYEYGIPPAAVPECWLVDSADAIKRHISSKVPVMVAGRITSVAQAEKIVGEGKSDLVGIGRPLIADPLLIEKYKKNEEQHTVPCLYCNVFCMGNLEKGVPIGCAVNPMAGKTTVYSAVPVDSPKKVVVIGGGIAGMEAANEAAKKGHSVEIFERSNSLGGLLKVACIPPFKSRYAMLLDYFTKQLEKNRVRVHLGTEADSASVLAARPDAVIVATGSSPVIPGFCKDTDCVAAQDFLAGKYETGQRPTGSRPHILIVGGGSVGVESAEYAALRGMRVTLVEMRDCLAPDMEWRSRKFMLNRLKEMDVEVLLNTRIVSLGAHCAAKVQQLDKAGAVIREYDTGEHDLAVVALGYKPNVPDGLLDALKNRGIAVFMAGDCANVGLVGNAMHSAFAAVRQLDN